MAKIRVDPEILRQSANQINDIQQKLEHSGREISNAANSAREYDGQFGPTVRAICNDAASRVRTLADRQRHLANSLQSKAQAFATADMASLQGFTATSQAIKDWQEGPWWLSGWNRNRFLQAYQFQTLMKLGGLLLVGGSLTSMTAYINQLALGIMVTGTFLGIRIPWLPSYIVQPTNSPNPPPQEPLAPSRLFASQITNIYNQPSANDPMKSGKKHEQIQAGQRVEVLSSFTDSEGVSWVKVKLSTGKEGWVLASTLVKPIESTQSKTKGENVMTRETDPNQIEWSVPEKEKTKDQFYWRYSRDDSSRSGFGNCTWYVAAAVKAESEGKINLNNSNQYPSLGGAGSWADNAENLKKEIEKYNIEDVNYKPEAGTVYQKDGHVMFVEEANLIELKDGKKIWQITISEENWGAGQSLQVKDIILGDINRTRRTLTLNVNPDTNEVVSGLGKFIHFNYNK